MVASMQQLKYIHWYVYIYKVQQVHVFYTANSIVPDTEPLVELALVSCSSCPFY